MTEISIGDFLKDTKPSGGSTEHLNLKAMGKAIVFLHPGSKIFKRNTYWFPWYGLVEENGTKTMKTHDVMIVCPGMDKNPIAVLRKKLRDDKSIDLDEVIMKVGKGDQLVEYTKGDIIGEEGYDWKKNLAYKTEYLFGVIDKDNADAVHPFVAPKSLGKKITKVIEDQIEEEGTELGNPFVNPYAFKLTFTKNASPNEMYNASWNKAEPTDEIKELLKAEGPDNRPLIEPTPIPKIAWLIRTALVEGMEQELGLNLSAADEFNPEDMIRKPREDEGEGEEKAEKKTPPAKKDTPKSPPKKANRPETKVEDEEDDDDDMIECPECEEEIPADSETCPHCGEDVSPF